MLFASHSRTNKVETKLHRVLLDDAQERVTAHRHGPVSYLAWSLRVKVASRAVWQLARSASKHRAPKRILAHHHHLRVVAHANHRLQHREGLGVEVVRLHGEHLQTSQETQRLRNHLFDLWALEPYQNISPQSRTGRGSLWPKCLTPPDTIYKRKRISKPVTFLLVRHLFLPPRLNCLREIIHLACTWT